MKKLSVSALALLLAIAAAPSAHADSVPGWYAGAGLGASIGVDPTIRNEATGQFGAEDRAVGLAELADVGYGWANGLRLEGEYFHNQNNVKSVAGLDGAGGHVSNNILFLNALYDFKTETRFTPYIGAGVGPDFASVTNAGASGAGYLTGDAVVGAYQGIAGVAAQLDRNWSVSADYRYVGSFDPKVGNSAGGEGRIENASHNIILGVRYSFAPEPVAPAAVNEPIVPPIRTAVAPKIAPHAPVRQAVAETPQSFMVFFDFNKSTLTPEAKQIIASAVQEYNKGRYVRINVTGHTDTVGSDSYNQKLSDRRAAAVAAEMKRLGVDASAISTSGEGKNGLMVPTANGVREAQNRRAEIVLAH